MRGSGALCISAMNVAGRKDNTEGIWNVDETVDF